MITTKRELEQLLIDHADDIRAFGVERLGVFGSFARGDKTAESDIDRVRDEFLDQVEHVLPAAA